MQTTPLTCWLCNVVQVVTGFRLAYGGAQEYYTCVPDMVSLLSMSLHAAVVGRLPACLSWRVRVRVCVCQVAYGKALGGGYPIGVFGGRRDVMALVEEHRLGQDEQYVWTASSLGGNPITSVAALAGMRASVYVCVAARAHAYEHALTRFGYHCQPWTFTSSQIHTIACMQSAPTCAKACVTC